MYDNEEKTNDRIIADALVRILENQIEIKRHFGLVKNDGYYDGCYYDNLVIDDLRCIE